MGSPVNIQYYFVRPKCAPNIQIKDKANVRMANDPKKKEERESARRSARTNKINNVHAPLYRVQIVIVSNSGHRQ